MTGRRRRALLAVLALLVALAAGCGVRPSGVITGGPAPAGPAQGVGLFFVANRRLALVLRPTPPGSVDDALASLLAGPDPTERRQGYTTEIPVGVGPATVTGSGASGTTVRLSGGVTVLSATAVDQIVCTVWNSIPDGKRAENSAVVTLAGADGIRGPLRCSPSRCPAAPGGADPSTSGRPRCPPPGGERAVPAPTAPTGG